MSAGKSPVMAEGPVGGAGLWGSAVFSGGGGLAGRTLAGGGFQDEEPPHPAIAAARVAVKRRELRWRRSMGRGGYTGSRSGSREKGRRRKKDLAGASKSG